MYITVNLLNVCWVTHRVTYHVDDMLRRASCAVKPRDSEVTVCVSKLAETLVIN